MVVGLVLAVIPTLLVAMSFGAWRDDVTEIAFHWDASGRVDGTLPALPVYLTANMLAFVGCGLSGAALLRRDVNRSMRRSVLLWSGTAAGLAMAIWVVPAGLTYAAGGARQAELGGWLVVMVAFLAYGVVLRAVVPPTEPLTNT